MERAVIKGKANHKSKKKTTRAVNLSITFCYACGDCFDLMLCKNVDFFSKKLVRENKCKQKLCITCLVTIMQTTKKVDFSHLLLYCTPAGTHLLRQHTFAAFYQRFLLKSPGLRVVSGPRKVLRRKQGRLTL